MPDTTSRLAQVLNGDGISSVGTPGGAMPMSQEAPQPPVGKSVGVAAGGAMMPVTQPQEAPQTAPPQAGMPVTSSDNGPMAPQIGGAGQPQDMTAQLAQTLIGQPAGGAFGGDPNEIRRRMMQYGREV